MSEMVGEGVKMSHYVKLSSPTERLLMQKTIYTNLGFIFLGKLMPTFRQT